MWVFDSMTIDNVKRIEVIRGPGSALYGNGAFSGVVNVVTKNGSDINGVVTTVGAGSFNSKKLNLQAGSNKNDLDVAFSFNHFDTDGDHFFIDNDTIGGSGYTNDFEKNYDTSLNVEYKDLAFNSRYTSRERWSLYRGCHKLLQMKTI